MLGLPPQGGGKGLREWLFVTNPLSDNLSEWVQEGIGALPEDLPDLHGLLLRVVALRREQAEIAEQAEELVSTLPDLELDVLRKAAEVPAETVQAVIHKLAIWDLVAEDHDEGHGLENAVVRSVLLDLRRLDGGQPAAG